MATLIVDQVSGPYTTISAAVTAAYPGDIIRVNPAGIFPFFYIENVVINTNDLRIKASAPGVILDGFGSGTGFTLNAPNTVINGFTIQNFHKGIEINSNYNRVINNTIQLISNYSGIYILNNYNDILNNIIQNISTLFGVEIWGNSNTISKNSITTANNHVVYIDGNLGGGINNKVKNNTITVPASNYSGVYNARFTQTNTIANNTINITPNSMGIRIDQSTNDVVRNNTLS